MARKDSTIADHMIVVGKSQKYEVLDLKFGNRHGLITGATGTGKTVTLQILVEGFSRAGVPVFAADIKGDLSGVAAPGEAKEAFVKRATDMGLAYQPDQFPVMFWDVFGQEGHPVPACSCMPVDLSSCDAVDATHRADLPIPTLQRAVPAATDVIEAS
jgi:DNA double-strand break repair helicase HerA and related ATPase